MKGKLAEGLLIVSGALLAVGAIAWALGTYIFWSMLGGCEDTILATAESPDGVHVASVIDRGCGATVGFIHGVVVYDAKDGFESDDSNVVYLIESQGEIALRWKNASHLVVGLSRAQGPPFQKSPTWHNIGIIYSYAE